MRKAFLLFLSLILIVAISGCNNKSNISHTPNQITNPTGVKGYDVVKLSDIPKNVSDWFKEWDKKKGAYIYQHPDYTYIKIAAEDNTPGGYSINQFVDNDYEKTIKLTFDTTNKIDDAVYLVVPSKSIAMYNVFVNGTEFKTADKVIKAAIESPKENDIVSNPMKVKGKVAAFEGAFVVKVIDSNEKLLKEEHLQTAGAPAWGSFERDIKYDTINTSKGRIEVGEYSAKDGEYLKYAAVNIRFK